MSRTSLLLVAAVLLTLAGVGNAPAAAGDIVVVVNPANPTAQLDRDGLRPLFQTTKTQWSDGKRVMPYNLPDEDPVRREFDSAVLRLDPERVARYWVDRKIRGGERPPAKLPNAAAVVRSVGANPGAIGYVREADAGKTLKIIARIRKGDVVPP